MKTPLSPREVHKQYEDGLSAFLRTIPDAGLRLTLVREVDPFFRSCALGVWRADGSTITTGYVEYYNAIYLRGNPPPSILYWDLGGQIGSYPGFRVPDFFTRMIRECPAAARRFADLFTLTLLLFAAVDGKVSDSEAGFVNSCSDKLNGLCGGESGHLNASNFVTGSNQPAESVQKDSEPEPIPSLEELLAQLDELCGLEQVKADVKSLINLVKVRKLRQEAKLPVPPLSLHLVFTGNPGTGKTTVARLMAKLYRSIGVLSKGQLVEVDRSGLVAGFVGQTAAKTQQAVDKALGGVLFIDEAYALTSRTGQNDFGQEAVEVILKNMEDHRDDLVVIVAGYTDLMTEFIHSNPGLESRFNKYFQFDDYNGEQLFAIFQSMCKRNGYVPNEDAETYAKEFLAQLFENRDENFGNARDVRNFFEKAVACQANRVAALETPTKEDLMILTEADLLSLERESKQREL